MADTKMMERLSDLRRQVQEAVIVCEHKEGSRLVHLKDVPLIIRVLGFSPGEEQIGQIVTQIKAQLEEETALVPYPVFDTVVVPWLLQNERSIAKSNFHTLMRAFKAFDPEGKGWIEAQVFKTALTAKGDALGADEAIKLIAACSDRKGRIWYQKFAVELQ